MNYTERGGAVLIIPFNIRIDSILNTGPGVWNTEIQQPY